MFSSACNFVLGKRKSNNDDDDINKNKNNLQIKLVPLSDKLSMKELVDKIKDKLDLIKDQIIIQPPLIYFNVVNHINETQLRSIYSIEQIKSIIIFANQLTMMLEVSTSLKPNSLNISNREYTNNDVTLRFKEPAFPIGKLIKPEEFIELNKILKWVLFYLYGNGVETDGSVYDIKKPYHIINIKLKPGSVISYHVINGLIINQKNYVKQVSIRFDTNEKVMHILLKCRF